jgi:Tfp pilus assembly protein PilN
MSENTNPDGSVDNTIGGAANAFMSILDPQTKEAEADPEVSADDSSDEETQYDEPQGEESDVSAEETDYEEEVTEEAPKYRVKANGEELEVSLDELLNGYSRTADYQKKTQSLAEQRKSVEAERVKIDEAAKTRDTYAQRLQVIEQLLSQQDSTENLQELKESDPIGYAIKVAERSEREKQLQAVQAERQRVQQEQQALHGQRMNEHIQSEQEKLKTIIPEFKDEAKAEVIRRDIRSYAKSIGFSDQELSQVYDSRAVQTLYKSMQYDKLMAGKAGATKKVSTAPKTIKPGTSNPQSSEQEAQKKDFAQLRKTGNKRDAAKLFERFL